MADKKDITGAIGAVPPPHAPRETTQALDPAFIDQQVALARQNEKPLAPFNPPQRPVAPAAVPRPVAVASPIDDLVSDFFDPAPAPVIVLTDQPKSDVVALSTQQPVAPVAPAEPYQPAASNTDTPSRGIPRATSDLGKQVTGGFGAAADAQYFPLDGIELRELVYAEMEVIHDRLMNDLRFSIAATYPRAEVIVSVEVKAYCLDEPMRIQRVITRDKTPIDVAVAKGAAPVQFDVTQRTGEFEPDGTPGKATNEIRAELGMQIPRKQIVDSGSGRVIVDVLT